MTALVIAASLVAIAAAAVKKAGPKPVTGLEGIWKMCYEPGLEEVHEIDSGYLVVMPDGRYYEVGESCCQDGFGSEPEPPYWKLGHYRTGPEGELVLETHSYAGEPYEIVLRPGGYRAAVFFDAVDSPARPVETLVSGDSLNYGYCRAYPHRSPNP